ncbi:Adaptive-response sensory-kinase SasA [Roseobacter fucihabitans]|uniref:histidine kinase n=1 Tax=Roseobacter fucihabitans TaxID=1537242 RepID=A0ABZ2C2C9_9RHOB|nr:ATP-binding protein [Roseobacter litoralis]MBC6965110.1 Osmolarity sensor protein EnvZ [Roseobacter litoralis]MBC6965887.1 Osmolarity sensor protein EnvZ [Roseobacter litoralis]
MSLLPDGLAGRFALLLSGALIAANVIALGVLSLERGRLDRAALIEREAERIVSFVPAIEAAAPRLRRAIARDASTRFSRVSVDREPLVTQLPAAPRSVALTREISQALGGRDVRAVIRVRPDREGKNRRESIAVSIQLVNAGTGRVQWLNVLSRGEHARPDGVNEKLFLIALVLSLVAVLGVSLVFLRRLTRPLSALAQAARRAGKGDRTARVPETGPLEMREAAAAFNDMQGRISQFDAERMRTLAAVGHDLRTPLTSLRIRAEMIEPEVGLAMIRSLDEMTVMADGLVSFAKDAGEGEEPVALNLRDLLANICTDQGAILQPGADVVVLARPVALGRAFRNLVENAMRYGGGACVFLDAGNGNAVVEIMDEGPGIADDLRESMFEPFVRGEDSRSLATGGAGLGLSIAKGIVRAHGGEIILNNRAEGGLRVTVTLPLAR